VYASASTFWLLPHHDVRNFSLRRAS
jgi:hypothetical protein